MVPICEAVRFDGRTLVVRMPIRFGQRRGSRRIVAPDGSEIVPTSEPQPSGTLVKALARAWRWQRMLDAGLYTLVSEIGEPRTLDELRKPDSASGAAGDGYTVETMLAGRTDQALMLDQLERLLPPS